MNFNRVILGGRLCRDPELKYLPNQTAVVEINVAINRKWKDGSGTEKEEVCYVDATCFGNRAEVLSKYVHKGDPLLFEGHLKLDQWEAQDGSKRSKMRVIIDNFQLLGGKREPGDGGGYGGEPADDRQAANLRTNARAAAQQSVQRNKGRVAPADASMRQQAPVAAAPDEDDPLPF